MDLTKKRKLDENNGQQPDSISPSPQLTLDDARSLISSFTHDQLLSIVQSSVLRHPDVLAAVRSVADHDPAQRKLFIRGLGWETTTEKLRALFSAYGEIEEGIVILDKATGKSKGYGFVTMKHVDGALLALKEPSKKIDGRMTVTQLAAAGIQGPVASSQPVGGFVDVLNRKIYVANVPYDMPGERLLAHFSSYGEVEEGPLGYDKATGKSRGYALFVYKTVEGARASLVDPIKTVDGHQLNCKLANEGKKGKPEVGGVALGVQGPAGGEAHGNGLGMHPPPSMTGPIGGQYGGPGGSYGGFSGGPQMGHHPMGVGAGGPGLSSVGSQAQPSMGVSSGGYGSGLGGPYGGSQYGGPGSTAYGGLGGTGGLGSGGGGLVGNAGGFGGSGGGMVGSAGGFAGGGVVGNAGGLGGAGGGLGGSAGSLGGIGSGLGGAGRGSSLYGGLPTSSVGLPSGGYPEGAHYSLSSSGYGSQHNHPAGTSPAARVPPGGMYQGGNPYY